MVNPTASHLFPSPLLNHYLWETSTPTLVLIAVGQHGNIHLALM